ncbi:MAG: SufD family Fe-S cluster assembly protein [Syntrophomonadaceae bacterium]
MLTAIDNQLLERIADWHGMPGGAVNIRKNGEKIERRITPNINIVSKTDKPGIDVIIKPGTKGESVHIPVILSQGMQDLVYNTFEVGAGADVTIVAGCGIHNPGSQKAEHDGIHEFFIRPGARMKYVEKHYGEGEGSGARILNPKTIIEIEEGGVAEIEMVQIKGVDRSLRDTEVRLHKNARLIVSERLLTYEDQTATSNITVDMVGEDATAQVISRSVAQHRSRQEFYLNMYGRAPCFGHIQCDSIIMDEAVVASSPKIVAYHTDAQLVHEAAIGKIASEQLTKLMCFGMTATEAEAAVLKGFLK